jgi:hypothetical protein
MGVKTRGGMWCDHCQRPVAGQRSTHPLRTIAFATALGIVGGAQPMYGEKWSCPVCGQAVRPATATAGFYKDPSGTGGWRYWDGTRWTDQVELTLPSEVKWWRGE